MEELCLALNITKTAEAMTKPTSPRMSMATTTGALCGGSEATENQLERLEDQVGLMLLLLNCTWVWLVRSTWTIFKFGEGKGPFSFTKLEDGPMDPSPHSSYM